MREELAVVGNGLAGVSAVEAILARGGASQFRITVFSEDRRGPYDRTRLPQLLRDPSALDSELREREARFARNNVDLRAGITVRQIGRRSRQLSDSQGKTFRYDKLIIATGSGPYIPAIRNMLDGAGALRKGVFTFRNIEDAQALASAAKPGLRVAVLGGGITGVDVATNLRELGLEVHIVALSPWLLSRHLNLGASAILQKRLEEGGIRLHFNKISEYILGSEQVSGISFRDGTTLDCDLVVIAAGSVPNTWLAFQSELSVERGIVVDNHMRCVDDPAIYAVGECAQHRGKLYGVPFILEQQCAVLADHITSSDQRAAFHGSKEVTQLTLGGIELTSMGEPNVDRLKDEVLLHAEPFTDRYQRLVIRNGRLASAILLGNFGKLARLSEAFQRGATLPAERLSLLSDVI